MENNIINNRNHSKSPGDRRESGSYLSSSVTTNGNIQSKEKGVMIICGPNAAPYEIFSYTDKWVDYYLDNGINVFVWNYRGYGDSTGKVNFRNMQTDAVLVVQHLRKELKFSNIGVHGISLGGIVACYLARYFHILSNLKSLIINNYYMNNYNIFVDLSNKFRIFRFFYY